MEPYRPCSSFKRQRITAYPAKEGYEPEESPVPEVVGLCRGEPSVSGVCHSPTHPYEGLRTSDSKGSIPEPQTPSTRAIARFRSSVSIDSSSCSSIKGLSSATSSQPSSYTADGESCQTDYVPGTTLPVEGWFQKCVNCGACTANTFKCGLEEVVICRRCVASVCGARKAFPSDCESTNMLHTENASGMNGHKRIVANENVDANAVAVSPLCEVLLNHHMPRRVGKVGLVMVTTSSTGQPMTRVVYS